MGPQLFTLIPVLRDLIWLHGYTHQIPPLVLSILLTKQIIQPRQTLQQVWEPCSERRSHRSRGDPVLKQRTETPPVLEPETRHFALHGGRAHIINLIFAFGLRLLLHTEQKECLCPQKREQQNALSSHESHRLLNISEVSAQRSHTTLTLTSWSLTVLPNSQQTRILSTLRC